MEYKDSQDTLDDLRRMISEAKKLNEETQDRAKGTRMLKDIVAHETARSRRRHDASDHPPAEADCADDT